MGLVWGNRACRRGAIAGVLATLAVVVAPEGTRAEAPTIRVAVPAGSLEKALLAFGRQSGLQLLYSTSVAAGKATPGFEGEMSTNEAIATLLAGTGLRAHFTSANTVRIFDPAALHAHGQAIQLETITVAGQSAASSGENVTGPVGGLVATQTATATKTSTPIIEVPQSISVVPQTQITAQGAQSISEALRYTPGVHTETLGAGDFSTSFMRVHGFIPDLYQDGLRLPNPPSASSYPEIEPYNLERIEVLKGPSSALYGSSGPGGIINMTSKRPLDTPSQEIAVQGGSFNHKQVQFDFSDQINGSPNALFRLVGLFRDSDHQINFFEDKRQFIAPSLTIKNDTTKLTLLGSYFHSEGVWNFFNFLPASGTVLGNPNGRIGMRTNSGDPTYDHLKREQFSAGYAFEHAISDAWTFRQNTRYLSTNNVQRAMAPERPGSQPSSNDPRTGLAFGDASLRNMNRTTIFLSSYNESFTIDNQLEGKFSTGPLAHTLVVGFDYRKLDSTYNYTLTAAGTSSTLDLYNPVYGAALTPSILALQDDSYKLEQSGFYVQDQIKWNGWLLTLGARNDWATTLTDNRLDPNHGFFGPKDRKFTGRVGLGYEFANGVVPYVSYATSFDPVAGADFYGVAFKPTTGEQWEAGIKYQPVGTKSLFTVAAFDITQQNVLTSDPINAFFSVQTGEVNVKGFEFEARTEVLDRLNIIAAYTYLNAEITKSNIPGEIGHRPNYTPEHQASLWAQYGLGGPLRGMTVGAGVRYVGETVSFQAGRDYGAPVGVVYPWTLTTPDYTLVDSDAVLRSGAAQSVADGRQAAGQCHKPVQ